jgi:hypothetical protein
MLHDMMGSGLNNLYSLDNSVALATGCGLKACPSVASATNK